MRRQRGARTHALPIPPCSPRTPHHAPVPGGRVLRRPSLARERAWGPPRALRSPSDAMFRKAQAILVGPRAGLEPLREEFVVPHFQVIDPPEYADVPYNRGTLAEQLRDHDAALTVELGGLAVVVDAIEELETRGVVCRHPGETLL